MLDNIAIAGDAAAGLPLLTPRALLALMVRTLGGVAARAQFLNFSPEPKGRTPFDLIARRYGKAAADLSLAILRLSQGIVEGRFETAGWGAAAPDLRIAPPVPSLIENDLRLATALGAAGPDDLRIPGPSGESIDFDLRMSAGQMPPKRRRGGQPGNINRRIHGRRSRRTAAINRYDRDLLHQARVLCKVMNTVDDRANVARAVNAGQRPR